MRMHALLTLSASVHARKSPEVLSIATHAHEVIDVRPRCIESARPRAFAAVRSIVLDDSGNGALLISIRRSNGRVALTTIDTYAGSARTSNALGMYRSNVRVLDLYALGGPENA